MKLFFCAVLGFLSFSLQLVKADITINAEASAGQMSQNMTMKFGSGNMRMDSQMGSMIFIGAEKKSIVLMPQTHQYMVMQNLNAQTAETQETTPEIPLMTRTGKRETINGFDCEQILMKSSK